MRASTFLAIKTWSTCCIAATTLVCLGGCPVEPIPPSSFCGELCVAASLSNSEDMHRGAGEDLGVDGIPSRDMMQQGGERVTCSLSLGEDDLILSALDNPDITIEKGSSFINITGPVGASISLTASGPESRPFSSWSRDFLLDAQCAAFEVNGLGAFAWGGVGVTLLPSPQPEQLVTTHKPRAAMDIDRGVLAIQVADFPWQLVQRDAETPSRLRTIELDALQELSSDAELTLSPDGQHLVAFNTSAMALVADVHTASPRVTQRNQQGSKLQKLKWDTAQPLLYALDDNAKLYRIDPEQGLTRTYDRDMSGFIAYDVMDGHVWALLVGGNIRHYSPELERLSAKAGPSQAQTIHVSQDQSALLVLSGSRCATSSALSSTPCKASLLDATTLSPLQDENALPVEADEVLGVIKTSTGFALLEHEAGELVLGLIDIDQGGTVTYTRHGEALQVSLEDLRPEHSMKTEAGFLLSGKEESIAAQVDPVAITRFAGAWRLWHSTHATIELIEEGQPWLTATRLILDRELTRIEERSGPGLSSNFEVDVTQDTQTTERISLRGEYLLCATPRCEPLPIPSGAPCLPYRHSTITAGRQSAHEEMITCGITP